MQRISRARLQLGDEVQVERAGVIALGMDEEPAAADLFIERDESEDDVGEECGAEALAFVAFVDAETCEERDRLRISSGAVIDEAARGAYRRRLQEVDDDIDEATRANDAERRARAEAERDYLVAELGRGFGLHGRSRRTGAAAERASSAVTRTINYAVARLREHHPSLAEHLDRALHTGTYVAYAPDPRTRITWDT